LINNAIIDWFLPWPEQALYAVSTTLLSEDVSLLRIAEK
jgi:dynein heavy chain